MHLLGSRYCGAGRAALRQSTWMTAHIRAPRCILFWLLKCSQTPPQTRRSHRSLSRRWNSHNSLRTSILPSESPATASKGTSQVTMWADHVSKLRDCLMHIHQRLKSKQITKMQVTEPALAGSKATQGLIHNTERVPSGLTSFILLFGSS